MQSIKETVVTNYYTGDKYFLVKINGAETYASEKRVKELNLSLTENNIVKNK